jgi:hypothetical protein
VLVLRCSLWFDRFCLYVTLSNRSVVRR